MGNSKTEIKMISPMFFILFWQWQYWINSFTYNYDPKSQRLFGFCSFFFAAGQMGVGQITASLWFMATIMLTTHQHSKQEHDYKSPLSWATKLISASDQMPQLMKEQVIFGRYETEHNHLCVTSYTLFQIRYKTEGQTKLRNLPCWNKVQGWAVLVPVVSALSALHCSSHTISLFHFQGNFHCLRPAILSQNLVSHLANRVILSQCLGRWSQVTQRRILVRRFLSLGMVFPWSWAWSQHPPGRGVYRSGWSHHRLFGTMCPGRRRKIWSAMCQGPKKKFSEEKKFMMVYFQDANFYSHCRKVKICI